jgi:methylated-DNA-[protein]-cysteine S-methyltransferase
MIYTDIINTPLGGIRARAQGDTLTGLWFIGQKYFPLGSNEWSEKSDYPVFKDLRNWLLKYFSGENPDPAIPLDPPGTGFQKSVWRALLDIPYGQVRTYGEIAKQIAGGKAAGYSPAQAVGNAVGHNPISLLIPCHRVIGADGSLRGYAGGLDKKSALLALEAKRP